MRKLDLSKITVDHLSGGRRVMCLKTRTGEEIGVELTAEKAQALRADLDDTETSKTAPADVPGAAGGAGGQPGLGRPRRSRRGVG